MKKKALLFVAILAVLACIFALSICAAEPSSSDEFGDVTIITDSDALNNKADYGYSEGDCARIVLQIPGTSTYVTYPMYYCFNVRNDGNYGMQPVPDFAALNTATGYQFDVTCVIRLEIPEYFTAISTNYTKSNQMVNMRYLKLNKNFIYIHQNALAYLDKLEEVVFVDDPSSQASFELGRSAFAYCTSLKTVILSTQVISVGERCFEGCKSLTRFDFGSRVTATGTASFLDCKALATVNIPENNSIVTVNHKTFQNCSALTGELVFANATFIDSYAFNKAATNEDTHLILRFPEMRNIGSSGDNHIFSESGVEKIYFGTKVEKMTLNNYNSCSRLTVIEIAGVAEGFAFNSYTFRDCTALKSFCIPEGITSLPQRMFENCSSMTAVYLPSTLTAIYSGDNSFATFNRCKSMYFVNEPFTSDNIPAEPDVYYFPKGLVHIQGETFDTSRLNDVVVFPEGLVRVDNGYAFEGTTSKSGNPTIVFMGNMESIVIKDWDVNKIYFCNSLDVDYASAGAPTDSRMVFCYGKDNTRHLAETVKDIEAGCEVDAGRASFCFCGQEFNKESIPDTALSHDYDYMNNPQAVLVAITYTNFGVDGSRTITCANCGVNADLVAKAIFVCQGYSSKMVGDGGIAIGFKINKDAMNEYTAFTGTELNFGVFAGVEEKIGGNDVVDANGNFIDGVLGQKLTRYTNAAFTIKVTGFTTDAHKVASLALGAYVIEGGKVSYIQAAAPSSDAKYHFASYNDVLSLLENQN